MIHDEIDALEREANLTGDRTKLNLVYIRVGRVNDVLRTFHGWRRIAVYLWINGPSRRRDIVRVVGANYAGFFHRIKSEHRPLGPDQDLRNYGLAATSQYLGVFDQNVNTLEYFLTDHGKAVALKLLSEHYGCRARDREVLR